MKLFLLHSMELLFEEVVRSTVKVNYPSLETGGRYVPGPAKWLEERQWERMPAEPPSPASSPDEPGADPVWECVVVDGHRYARRKAG